MNGPLRRLALVALCLFGCLFVSTSYVQFVDAATLNAKPGNARTIYKEFGRERGQLVVAGHPIAESVKSNDQYQYQRRYPGGALYSAVTGYYSVIYGSTGMENATGDLLSGTSDQLFYRRISDLFTGHQPQGATVQLTIDPKAQRAAWDALGDQRGAVVALDPKTGKILALVSKPAFDPNVLASHNSTKLRADRAKLLADPDRPLENRAISSQLYHPGSTFKLITGSAALSTGRYTPDTLIPGPPTLKLPQTTISLANDDHASCGPGDKVSLLDALRISCNTAFGSLGMTLGGPALRDQANKYGFGQALRIPVPVTPSIFPATLEAPQVAQSAIGQFDVKATPIQMAMVSSAIANGGVLMTPTLVEQVVGSDFEVISKSTPIEFGRPISPEVAAQLTTMMEAVVTGGTGTHAQIDGIVVAGKTGTAQQGPGQPPDAWFTAFAPADNPRVAVAVVVEDGGPLGDTASGGTVAAPIAKKVIEAVIKR